MKSMAAILPLCDLVFLALGGILATMTQMEVVHALPIEITRVGTGAAIVQHDKFKILSVTADQMVLDGISITEQQLADMAKDKKVILRVSKELRTERTVSVISSLAQAGAQVLIEVEEQTVK